MSRQDETTPVKSIYDQYVVEAESRIKNFWEGRYNTFDVDVDDEPWVRRDFVQNNLEKIRKFYAFVRLIDEIYHLDFIDRVCSIAEKHGFKLSTPLIKEYANKAILALDLALHFPLWGRETYTNVEFHALGFRKEKAMKGYDRFVVVGTVPILRIEIDENNELLSITPYDWEVIQAGLSTIL